MARASIAAIGIAFKRHRERREPIPARRGLSAGDCLVAALLAIVTVGGLANSAAGLA
jgi:hypothetical protein